MDLFGWVDEQRDRNSQAFYRLLEQGRATWTPRDIFNRCCVKWLVDGNIQYDEYAGFYDEYCPRNGCNGCSRDHPCITLRFNANNKSTAATLSHRLDPFVRCMVGLVAEEKAWPHSATEYHLDGYLRANESFLRSHDGFGRHLIKVARGEMEASDAAQAAELEEKERSSRAAKRPRRDEGERSPVLDVGELAKAMDIALGHRLQVDLQSDPLTLFCMRQVCKTFKKIASSIASTKVKTLDLTITPLVNGTQKYGEYKLNGYDTETFDADGYGPEGPEYIAEYVKREKISLAFHQSLETEEGGYRPMNTDAATFSWDSGRLDRDAYEEEVEDYDDPNSAEYAYCGQMLRVYWQPKEEDPVQAPKRGEGVWGEAKPDLGFCIAEFTLRQQPSRGVVSKSQRSVSINYEVLESNASETEEVYEEEEGSDYETDEDAEDGFRRVVNVVEKRHKFIQYSGKIKLIDAKIDFGVIVRLHALQVMRELQREYSNILRERPLTKTEKEYQELVAAACSERIRGA